MVIPMRKPRKQRSVIGWELRRQLREPGWGLSIVRGLEGDCNKVSLR